MNEPHLPNRFWYLLPEHVLYEAATALDPEKMARKLHRILYTNRARIALGRHWNHIAEFEFEPGTCVERSDLIYRWVPRNEASWDDSQWRSLCTSPAATREFDARKKAFDERRDEFATLIRSAAQERYSARLEDTDWSVLQEFVCAPASVMPMLTHFASEYDCREWHDALSVFPDQHAVGRFWRILLWFFLRSTKLGQRRLRNDWEDGSYAFLASYADEFWTLDNDLADVSRLLFPSVEVKGA